MKLNSILNNKVIAYGFAAFKGLEAHSNPEGTEVVISTLSPAVMADMGIYTYYAPVLPRNTIFTSTEDIIAADLDAQLVNVLTCPAWDKDLSNIVIVSRHQGTIDLLKSMYPDAQVLSGNVTPDDIKGLHVIGTLPPHLIQYCKSYRAVTIKDFDYTKDGDLSGDELLQRIVISNPIRVQINFRPGMVYCYEYNGQQSVLRCVQDYRGKGILTFRGLRDQVIFADAPENENEAIIAAYGDVNPNDCIPKDANWEIYKTEGVGDCYYFGYHIYCRLRDGNPPQYDPSLYED